MQASPGMFVIDLATEQERQLTTGKRAERTKRDFRCPICRSAIDQASSLILRAPSSTDDPGLLLNQPNVVDGTAAVSRIWPVNRCLHFGLILASLA